MTKTQLPPIKIFVFGTLRKGCRLHYYMDGCVDAGIRYTRGQLMMAVNGNAYIDFSVKDAVTVGELYYTDFSGLLRIDHLESASGEFPKGYDLNLIPIQKDAKITNNEEDIEYAFVYIYRNKDRKITSGDWALRRRPVEEIRQYLESQNDRNPESLIRYVQSLKKD
ncbi:MAG: hypothetical protein CSB06_02450 [Bacteroidia bacterium]|nr:MAG: hypothetical protein CSB06_02450 [Bacteroidia bacterium]